MDALDYAIRKSSASEINAYLGQVFPNELKDCSATHHYPLSETRVGAWLDLSGVGPIPNSSEGEPAFLKDPTESQPKQQQPKVPKKNYVYGKGLRGEGYYHLECRSAYHILFKRLQVQKDVKIVTNPILQRVWYRQRPQPVPSAPTNIDASNGLVVPDNDDATVASSIFDAEMIGDNNDNEATNSNVFNSIKSHKRRHVVSLSKRNYQMVWRIMNNRQACDIPDDGAALDQAIKRASGSISGGGFSAAGMALGV